ncbi:unnamed protein product [Rotaria sp. Silwood2]|nr:unnamed protein product [Rotaria sp. Silwood2]CAF4598251.1 unnamed protein product [Rotaria sp. Silwood2]
MQMNPVFQTRQKAGISYFAGPLNLIFVLSGQLVIVNSSRRHMFEANGGTGRDYRTALICISAGGQVLPLFILYAGKHLINTWCKGGPIGTQYGVTKKGWIDTPMYEYWLEHLFIPSTAHLSIWPFDADAMRDKVVHNTTTPSTTAFIGTSPLSTNILLPWLQSSTTPSCSPASVFFSSTTLAIKSIDVSTNTDPPQSSPLSNTFDQITPLQPTVFVNDDDLIQSSITSSYTTLQSCPLDLTSSSR